MATSEYCYLVGRVGRLQKALLPRSKSPTGSYRDSVYERTRAFKVLICSEIEFYFEQACSTIAVKAYDSWDKRGASSSPILALSAYYNGVSAATPDQKNGNRSEHSFQKRVKDSYSGFRSKISDNNGIKESNILGLLLPIGVTEDQIPDDLLIALNNYGGARCLIAHSTRAQQKLSPDDAESEVANILRLLTPLDALLETITTAL